MNVFSFKDVKSIYSVDFDTLSRSPSPSPSPSPALFLAPSPAPSPALSPALSPAPSPSAHWRITDDSFLSSPNSSNTLLDSSINEVSQNDLPSWIELLD